MRDYQTVALSYVILMVNVYMTAGKMERVKSPVLLTLAVVVSVFASLIIAYGRPTNQRAPRRRLLQLL